MLNPKYSVLYVDDEEINLRSFESAFRKKYNIYTALSAADGLNILENEEIDIILSDQRMPKMTGVEFLKKASAKFPSINRVLITGYTDFNELQTAINDAKIFQYVQKPWKTDNLEGILSEGLRIHELEKNNEKLTVELQQLNKALIIKNKVLEETNSELLIAKQKAEESDKLKDHFVRNMSHEIRTPLNAIVGFSELITKLNITDVERSRFNEIIVNNSNQLLRTMDKILVVSRLETEHSDVVVFPTDINKMFHECYLNFELEAKEKKIDLKLTTGLPDDKCTILLDDIKVNLIMSNLVENAIKYTPEGEVEIGYSIENDKLKIYIKDNGIGISESDQKNIFNRFYQIDNSKLPRKGLGLGLTIVQIKSQLLKGEITVNSKVGQGSVFTLTIPFEYA